MESRKQKRKRKFWVFVFHFGAFVVNRKFKFPLGIFLLKFLINKLFTRRKQL